jgi:hypothetical protein
MNMFHLELEPTSNKLFITKRMYLENQLKSEPTVTGWVYKTISNGKTLSAGLPEINSSLNEKLE